MMEKPFATHRWLRRAPADNEDEVQICRQPDDPGLQPRFGYCGTFLIPLSEQPPGQALKGFVIVRLLAILAVLIGAIAIPAALRADEPQTVVVDTEHNFLSGRKTFPPPYRIKPCTSFTVDGTAFEFELPAEFRGRVPDALQVTDLGKKMYIVHWSDNDRRAALSVATMIPYGESLPFSGFKSGETYFLSIGHLAETPEETAWVWFGAVEVE